MSGWDEDYRYWPSTLVRAAELWETCARDTPMLASEIDADGDTTMVVAVTGQLGAPASRHLEVR